MAVPLSLLLSGGGAEPAESSRPYPEGPPPGHTGGFGDPTCHACHSDHPLNAPGGRLGLEGLPGAYDPGASYEVRVTLLRKGMARAGFQTAVRIAQGDDAGRQAGSLSVSGRRVRRVPHPETRVAYLHQTREGSRLDPGDHETGWIFTWVAPEPGVGPVVFHVAANAGNDDASEFGDRVYTDSAVVEESKSALPERIGEGARETPDREEIRRY